MLFLTWNCLGLDIGFCVKVMQNARIGASLSCVENETVMSDRESLVKRLLKACKRLVKLRILGKRGKARFFKVIFHVLLMKVQSRFIQRR